MFDWHSVCFVGVVLLNAAFASAVALGAYVFLKRLKRQKRLCSDDKARLMSYAIVVAVLVMPNTLFYSLDKLSSLLY